ncbi:hypothetical protein [Mesorhizobium sp. CN2-181]|uniref:hypothetical protein n=1 Tax=Mesorhizobium yinganensis TaxID=3157707 RepID=UPI0032B75C92
MTPIGFFIRLGLSAALALAAVCALVVGTSDGAVTAFLFLSALVFGITILEAAFTRQADHLITQFPGPVVLSAPTWQRVVLALWVGSVAAFLIYGAVVGKAGPRDDWEFTRLVVIGTFGLVAGLGALCMLPRRLLILDADGLEYQSVWGTYSFRWSAFSRFYLAGSRWRFVMCEYAGQPHRKWLSRRALMITAPIGISKHALAALLTKWQARALASEGVPSPQATGPAASHNRNRSLLDYA